MIIKNNSDKSIKKKIIKIYNRVHNKVFWEIIYKNSNIYKLSLLIFVGFILTLIISPQVVNLSLNYHAGDIASKNIKAPQNFLVEDQVSTQKRRMDAKSNVSLIFDNDPDIFLEIKNRMDIVFSYFYTFYNNPVLSGKLSLGREKFEEIIGVEIHDASFKALKRYNFHPVIKDQIITFLKPIYKNGVVNKKEILSGNEGKGIVLRNIKTKDEIAIENIQKIYDLKEAKTFLQKNLISPFQKKDKEFETNLNLFA
ncbi:MAG: hypothetical protein SV062_13575, partial [Thermodesulfobacteriota bacterium]|nr:hypothetical protein [Thermodesulfobacteriota bacterium]